MADDPRASDFRKRGLAAFCREFAAAWGGVLGATLGLGLIMAAVITPLDEVEAWWEWLITIPLALVTVVIGCGIVVLSAGALLTQIGVGWYGMLVGRCPADEYGPRANNGARAIANAFYLLVAVVLGTLWFRAGSAGGALNWAMEGLLLAFSGIAFGLGSLVPRLYFRRPGRTIKVRELKLPEQWIGLVIAATLGAGLSFGICKGFAETKERAAQAAEEAKQ